MFAVTLLTNPAKPTLTHQLILDGSVLTARVVDGAVAIDAAPAGVPPVLTWEIA